MSERYVVTTPEGVPVIRTDSTVEAERYCRIMGGHIIEHEGARA